MEDRELRLEEQDLRILKTILSDPLLGSEFANTYDESLFIGDSKRFAKSVISYIRSYKSLPTKRVMLEHFSDATIQAEIQEVWDAIQNVEADSSEFKYDLDKIKHRHSASKLVGLRDLIENGGDLKTIVKTARTELDAIDRIQKGQRQAYVQKTLKTYMPEFKQGYAAKFNDKGLGRGILTGYSFLDYVKNGMMSAEMMIIGGETGAGKSMLLNNMAIQMWMQKNTVGTPTNAFVKGCNVLYFSLEMPYEACARRTLARVADIPMYGLRDSSLSKPQTENLARVSDFIERYPFEFEIVDIPRGVTVEQIEARFHEAMVRYNPDIVVVDYLGLLEDADAEGDDWLKLGYIAGKLHEFARAYNIIVLTAVQLNRPTTKSVKDPSELIGIHRIGRSSLIMHHANIGIQIESRKDEQTYTDMKYHVIKNRDGELGSHTLIKNFKNASVLDMDPPFTPKVDESGYISNGEDVEDISTLLAKYKWDKVNG